MKPIETTGNPITVTNQPLKRRNHSPGSYQKVHNGRKQPIRGLWVRNGRFYARMAVRDPNSGKSEVRRIPLGDAQNPVETIPQAEAALRRLKTKRDDNSLPILRRTPKLSEYVKNYFDYFDQVKDQKRPATVAKERSALKLWVEHMGETHLNMINRAMINAFIAKRQGDGKSGRTVNLDVIALRNVLKRAIDDGYLTRLPTENLRPLKSNARKRRFFSLEEIQELCRRAESKDSNGRPITKNGQQLSDYVKLMTFCGARRDETLRLKWTDIDWDRRQLTIGSDGLTKNRKSRVVDLNSNLETHLLEMQTRRVPDSQFLFPSPQRGTKDIHVKTFKESLNLARKASELTDFNFHDCRHFFISYCVMSQIDYMTIARWVGHADGGVLIGKVYGHLSNEHAQRQAGRVTFGPVILKQSDNVSESAVAQESLPN